MGNIKPICKTTVRFTACNTKLCNLDPIDLSDSHNHKRTLFTTTSNSFHIRKWLYFSSGALHGSIVHTGSIISIILVGKLESSNPNSIMKPSNVYILNITSYKLPSLGCCNLLTRDDKFLIIDCEFLNISRRLSILSQESLRVFQGQFSLLVTEDGTNKMVHHLLTTESKWEDLSTTSKFSHFDAQDLGNNNQFYYNFKIQRPEKRVDKVFQCRTA